MGTTGIVGGVMKETELASTTVGAGVGALLQTKLAESDAGPCLPMTGKGMIHVHATATTMMHILVAVTAILPPGADTLHLFPRRVVLPQIPIPLTTLRP